MPSHVRRTTRVALLVGVLLLAAGCTAPDGTWPGTMPHEPMSEGPHGGVHHGQAATPTIDGADELDIVAGAMRFDPDRLELVAGEPVNLTLRSTDAFHDLVIAGVGFHVAADAGEQSSAGLRIDAPGTYLGYCSVPGHRAAGMEMWIEVT